MQKLIPFNFKENKMNMLANINSIYPNSKESTKVKLSKEKAEARKKAEKLLKKGMSVKLVCEKIGLNVYTVASWKTALNKKRKK